VRVARPLLAAFVMVFLGLALSVPGLYLLGAISGTCGRATSQNCPTSLSPSGGSVFVGTILFVTAVALLIGGMVLLALSRFVYDRTITEPREAPAFEPSPDVDADPEGDPTAFQPLAPEVTFRIDRVEDVRGQGCVVFGELEEGVLSTPSRVRLVPGPGSTNRECVVEALRILVDGHVRTRIEIGGRAEVTLRGVASTRMGGLFGQQRRFWVDPGDRLTSV
jgi:hypothetical protein